MTIDYQQLVIVCHGFGRRPDMNVFKTIISRQSGRSPLPEPCPQVGRSPKDREMTEAAETKLGGGGGQEGGAGLGALRELGEQLVAEQEEEVEEALLKPNGSNGR